MTIPELISVFKERQDVYVERMKNSTSPERAYWLGKAEGMDVVIDCLEKWLNKEVI